MLKKIKHIGHHLVYSNDFCVHFSQIRCIVTDIRSDGLCRELRYVQMALPYAYDLGCHRCNSRRHSKFSS